MTARRARAFSVITMLLPIGLGRISLADFVNWETPQVHPLDKTPDGSHLLAVNTADDRLEVFDITTGAPVKVASIPVGLDPVSVRARTDTEAWVVNQISDTVSVVDLSAKNVVATLTTEDEPADVVFAGKPLQAFVTCSQANSVMIFDPANLSLAPMILDIVGEDPRAMTVNADGTEVYVAVFESGNDTTILGGGSTMMGGFPPNAVSDPGGPYGGMNPPPNDGFDFNPPQNPSNPPPPAVGLIVRKDANGHWMDDNDSDWTAMVSGSNAALSGRPVGWDLADHDLAIIDADTLAVSYVTGLMNICMAVAVNPSNGEVTVVGTDATNEVRFEPVIDGKFIRVEMARVNPMTASAVNVTDLNTHLTYSNAIPFVPIPQAQRDMSVGDPRAIVWESKGSRGFVAGMGSNNLIVIDAAGNRAGLSSTIEVDEGPTGLVLDEDRGRLYVLSKFAATVSAVDLTSETVTASVSLHDATPVAIKVGRKHLYDTHLNSGLGQIACASCHVDARMDQLAWDLGDPSGDVKGFGEQNCQADVPIVFPLDCEDWQPMKGPMTTLTLQDIIGKEPHHWRGDRDGLEEFSAAFQTLQGDDVPLPPLAMQEFENFLATIHFPPNPFRNFDNTLPDDLPLPGHFITAPFQPEGQPLPNGDAVAGLAAYRTSMFDADALSCVTCHTLPTGAGTNYHLVNLVPQPIPVGPNGEFHHMIVAQDGSTNVSMKVPELRNLYEKVGFETSLTLNTKGFGFLHDGSVDSLARFLSEPVFTLSSVQEVADQVAFLLSFAGSDLQMGSPTNPLELPGPTSQDTHAAVGKQTTVLDGSSVPVAQRRLINDMIALANAGATGLVVKGRQAGEQRGYVYVGGSLFQSDRAGQTISTAALQASAAPGSELTYTVVPDGTQTRIGIDRDDDGHYDRDELDVCSNPADAASIPGGAVVFGDGDGDGDADGGDFLLFAACQGAPGEVVDQACRCAFDSDADNDVDLVDFQVMQIVVDSGG